MADQIANFAVTTVQGSFAPGTVGGAWSWILALSDGTHPADGPSIGTIEGNAIVEKWETADAFSSQDVYDGNTYIVYVQRHDAGNMPLGPIVKTEFSTKDDPEQVLIDVAGAVSVTLASSGPSIGV